MSAPSLAWPEPAVDFVSALIGEREVAPRAQLIAAEVAMGLPGSAVIVYILDPEARCAARGHAGDITRPRRPFSPDGTALRPALQSNSPVIFKGEALRRELYQHLDLRREVKAIAYLPLALDEVMVGAIEIISFAEPIHPEQLHLQHQLVELASLALATAISYEAERNSQFGTISRLTQLYDLERSFNSTLLMERLLPLITSKIRESLEVEYANLWMLDEEGLMLMSQAGADPTCEEGCTEGPAMTIAREVNDTGKSVLINSPLDERLTARNEGRGNPLRSVLAVPIVSQNYQVGVLEIANKLNGQPFGEEDAFYFATISITAGSALHNASLLEAERKIEILETLVTVSHEITSTLNLERVLQVIVNGPQRILSYDRAAIALQQFGSLQIRCISGQGEIVQHEPAVKRLREAMQFSASEPELHVMQHGNDVAAEREQTRAEFKEHFAATGHRGWYSVRLDDDQGLLGVLAFESHNPDFLGSAQLEFIKVIAGQATVAIRNASLYKEVPLIGVLEPLLQKKQALLRGVSGRKLGTIAGAAIATALIVVPLPLRVVGDASISPSATAHIQALEPGVVSNVYVRDGQSVTRGAVLAQMEDADYEAELAGAQAKYAQAMSAKNAALAANDGAEAGLRRVEAEYWRSEVERNQRRVRRTRLVAPFDGIVVGPQLDVAVGRHLVEGESLCDVVDSRTARVDVQLDEDDLPLLRGAENVALKVDAFPLRTFRGTVALLSPASVPIGDRRAFFARAQVFNDDGLLRAGMKGRGKIKVGWRPSGYVLFRGVGTWLWEKLWSMFGG